MEALFEWLHSMEDSVDRSSLIGDAILYTLNQENYLRIATELHLKRLLVGGFERVFEIDELVVVEKYIQGTELTVAVLGNRDPFALPVIEIVPKADFYDFESKYAPGGSQHICPAPLDEEKTKQVMDAAVGAHKALQCSGVSRSDFILDENGIPWILETNTIPGMTATSLLPDAARAAGISFPELCTKLIEYAFEEGE